MKDAEIIKAAEQHWPNILGLIGVRQGTPNPCCDYPYHDEAGNVIQIREIATCLCRKSREQLEQCAWHWKTVTGLLTLRSGLIRDAEDGY